MSVRTRIIIDLAFYLGVPLLIWNLGRGVLGDYLAMFLSALSGISYTAYKFYSEKKYNITGVMIVFGICLNLILNVNADSAIEILYNSQYLNGTLGTIYLVSVALGKPMGQYFYIDYRRMHGEDRGESLKRLESFTARRSFYFLTGLLAAREAALFTLKWVMIRRVGVEGTNQILLASRMVSYTFVGLIAVMTMAINKKWKLKIDG